jgi:iron complex outermembrane recepter protein
MTNLLKLKAAILCLGVTIGAGKASAQAPQNPPSDQVDGQSHLEEIVVSARKVDENLQTVPVSITVLSGQQLREQSATRLTDVVQFTPGLAFRPAVTGDTGALFQLRGQFQNDAAATLDQSVGIYVDGLYWARAYGVNGDLLDVENVQVLKGPQGTLFGRNTTGGAILMQTADPKLDGISGSLSGTYGRFNERSLTGVINLPIVEDKVGLRVAGELNKRDGYIKDYVAGTKYDNRNNYTLRGKLLLKPTERLTVLLSAENFHSNVNLNPFKLSFVGPGSVYPLVAGSQAVVDSYIAQTVNSDRVSLTTPSVNRVTTQTYTGTVTLDTSYGAVKLIGGHRQVKNFSYLDISGGPFDVFRTPLTQNLKQNSVELQTTGKALDDRLAFAAGLFWFRETGREYQETYALPGLNPDLPLITDGDINTRSRAIYGQATYHITDKLSFTGGLRYSVEDKGLTLRNKSFMSAQNAFVCSIPSPNTDCSVYRSDRFKGWSYTAGFEYAFDPDTLVYAKINRGFRSGGQNLRASGSAAFVPFKPEYVTSYETGLKSEFFNRRVRFNLAAYYSRVKDIQRTSVVTAPDGTALTIIGNAGKARYYGGEAELSALVLDNLRFGATAAVIEPKYLEYNDGVQDRTAERFDAISRFSFTLTANYWHETSLGKINLHGDYSWQSKTVVSAGQPYTPSLDPINPPNVQAQLLALTTDKPYGILNGRISLTTPDERMEFAVFGRNLTNNRVKTYSFYLPGVLNFDLIQRHEPITYGISASYKFGAN